MGVPFLGQITMFAGTFAPRGWALCQGQVLNIAQNTALFSILGTTYGGNGQTTFALPDLRSRVPVGQGQGTNLSAYALGQQSGAENGSLQASNIPSHNHTILGNEETVSNSSKAGGNYFSSAAFYVNTTDGSQMAQNVVTGGGNGQGTGNPFPVIQPVLCLNFIICIEGIYPSRN